MGAIAFVEPALSSEMCLEVWSFDGCAHVRDENELLARLRSVRRGPDGAFILSHGGNESLWVHFHAEAAFLWFQPNRDGTHAGFVPNGMWQGERHSIRFLLTSGFHADAIEVPWWQLVSVEAAYRAAVEFLHAPELPQSVTWLAL